MIRLSGPVLFFLLALGLGSGCDANLENDLIGTTWVLDHTAFPPGDSTESTPTTLRFASETEVAINSCNQCSGGYRSDGNVLAFTGLGCTEIGCGIRLDLGPRLADADRVVYSLSDDGLILVAERDGLLSTFTFVAESGGPDGDG
ncbi:MAG: META domain-containing protein [Rhodothermales bacterium]